MLSFVLTTFLFGEANAHGRLTVPTTRLGNPAAYENNPIGFGGTSGNLYACRHALNPSVTKPTVSAGDTIDVQWLITALHVGDAAVYISYDYDEPLSDIQNMEFFKIANIRSPKDSNQQPYTINLPDWLPSGNAVLRWEWAATHVYPTIELYAQCSDIVITGRGGDTEKTVAEIPKYRVVSNGVSLTIPSYDSDGKIFNPFSGGNWFQTGPECALGYSENQCGNTAVGTTGHVDMFGNQPPRTTTAAPAPGTTTDAPVTTTGSAPPATTTQDGCVDDSRWAGAQCGGSTHAGSTCCPSGLACQAVNDYYSGCFEQCYGPSWACNNPAPTTTAAPTVPTTQIVTAPVGGCNVESRGSGAQCDGATYNEDESQRGCCATGFQCYREHEWWSGCWAGCPTWAESCD